jgi:hypothetical protein
MFVAHEASKIIRSQLGASQVYENLMSHFIVVFFSCVLLLTRLDACLLLESEVGRVGRCGCVMVRVRVMM